MHPMFAPDKPLAEPMQRIVLDLHDSSRSHIVLATTDDPGMRCEAMAELGKRLSGTYALYDFDYTHTDQLSLPRYCRTLRNVLPVCIFAHGLEKLAQANKDHYETALHFLNAHREDIRDTQSTVVLWLTAQTYADLLQQAPDFADWRTADVSFALPDGWHVERMPLGKLSLAEAEDLRGKMRRFKDMLARPNLKPALAAEFNKQLAYILKQLGHSEESEEALAKSSRTSAALADYKRLEDLYRQHIVDHYGKLTLYSIASDTPLAVDLERIFVKLTATQRRQSWRVVHHEAWEEELVEAEQLLPATGSMLHERHTRRTVEEVTVPLSVSDALATYPCLTIIGAPGAGKTTLLKYLALTFARDQAYEQLGLDEVRLPIFVALRDFNRFLDNLHQRGELAEIGPQLLPRFLNQHINTLAPHLHLPEDFFSRQLEAHNCMVLLDGLDEVSDPFKRSRTTEALAAFTRHYRGNRFMVTSRPRGYEGETKQRLTTLFTDCSIRDFDDTDMAEFARSWYEAITRDRLGDTPDAIAEGQRQADDLLRAIHADERVQALAHNPLLLSVLAMLHQRGVGLPQRRAELYDECTDMLLGYWDQVKGGEAARELAAYGELTRSEKRTLLEPIALWFHERGAQGLEVDQMVLEQEIAHQFQGTFRDSERKARRRAELFLRVIDERAGLLVERETGVYAFAHLTFQEYLAARAIADQENYIDYTLRHLHDPWWREVILLEVGHLSDMRHFGRRARNLTTDLIRAIRNANSWLEKPLKRDLLLAVHALVDVGPLGVDETLRQCLINEVLTLWHTTPYQAQREAIVDLLKYALQTINGGQICDELLHCIDNPPTRAWAAQALRSLGERATTEPVLTALLACLQDPEAEVRQAAAQALGSLGERATTEPVLTALLACLQDPEAGVFMAAADTLGHLGERAVTEPVLTALVAYLHDTEAGVREIAARTLGRLRRRAVTEPVLTALVACLHDTEARVRRAAASTLGRLGERAATEPVLTALVACLHDTEARVRKMAAWALGRLGQRAATETVLTALVVCLGRWSAKVREAAAWALGYLGERAATESVLTALVACLRCWSAEVRLAAAWALGQMGEKTATTDILTRLAKFWQRQLNDTNVSLVIYRPICDVAYDELLRIANHLAAGNRMFRDKSRVI